MAIEFNDNVFSKSPKPLDAKSYVGEGHLFRYKENITATYKFPGMVIRDTDDNTLWRWTGSIWLNITPNNNNITITINTYTIVNDVMDETSFIIPLDYGNIIVFINGVMVKSSDYILAKSANTTIVFNFPVELGDVIHIKKF